MPWPETHHSVPRPRIEGGEFRKEKGAVKKVADDEFCTKLGSARAQLSDAGR